MARVRVRGRALWLCVALLAALPASAPASDLDDFAGTWVRDERERDDLGRSAVIERVTQPMSFAFRGFARGVMGRRMRPPEQYVIERSDGVETIRSDKGSQLPIDGRPHPRDDDQEVTSRFTEEGTIEQSWRRGADSHGTAVWRLSGSGSRLVVSETIHDPHFAEPVAFSTTYRRLAAEP